ncbi:MAG: TlyA family RNA methyltransferase [Canibacter sp.]
MVQRSTWHGEPERLDKALAHSGLARSRSHAAELILDSRVRHGNKMAKKSAASVRDGDNLTVIGEEKYVSRAAKKLDAALDSFDVDASDLCALDIGASTGGFTQVLLERGATTVIALDVGHDQLDPKIRHDARVSVVEGCNARFLERDELVTLSGTSDEIDLIVGDLSFISLSLILPAMRRVSTPHTQAVMLIKPQFEVGREHLSNGIVRDPTAHAAAIHRVFLAAVESGFTPVALAPSPIFGQHGNREYLVHLVSDAQPNPTEWDEMITRLTLSPSEGGKQ